MCSFPSTKGILEDSWSLLIARRFRVGVCMYVCKSVTWSSVTSHLLILYLVTYEYYSLVSVMFSSVWIKNKLLQRIFIKIESYEI